MAPAAEPQELPLTEKDLQQLSRRGISPGEIRRQWALLRNPPPRVHLDRPCTVGDGIETLPPEAQEERIALFDAAAAAGRWSKVVPASGAASRMFRSLLRHLAAGEAPATEVLAFCSRLQDFAFWEAVPEADRQRLEGWQRERRFEAILQHLLLRQEGEGLGFSEQPKGLIPFHTDPGGGPPRTPVMEHLVEAAELVRRADGTCHLAFTVSPESEAAFQEHLAAIRGPLEAHLGVRFVLELSPQSPATDTVALGTAGALVHQEGGGLLFRPGGHGALIRNLETLAREGADLLLLKNIDNVQPQAATGITLRWKRILGGTLLHYQERCFALLRRLHGGMAEAETAETAETVEEALAFLRDVFGLETALLEALPREVAPRRAFALERLHRPLRVCGVVVNRGEPGGGPFWVGRASDPAGRSRQIVESAQIDQEDPEQRAILAAATHFNPVDLACGVRDFQGEPFPLQEFVDPRTAFVAQKSHLGETLWALERPGLWNGAMAHWNTLFLEVPGETFTPVKTVLDLLRPEHLS